MKEFNYTFYKQELANLTISYKLNDYGSCAVTLNRIIKEFNYLARKLGLIKEYETPLEISTFFTKVHPLFKGSKKLNVSKSIYVEFLESELGYLFNENEQLFNDVMTRLVFFKNKYCTENFEIEEAHKALLQNIEDEKYAGFRLDLISLSVVAFISTRSGVNSKNGYTLFLIDSIYQKIAGCEADGENILSNQSFIQKIYYQLFALKKAMNIESTMWSDLNELDGKDFGRHLKSVVAKPIYNIRASIAQAFSQDKTQCTGTMPIKEMIDSVMFFIRNIVNDKKYELFSKRIVSCLEPEIKNYNHNNIEHRCFVLARVKDIMFALKVIMFQEYCFNIDYNLNDYYINLINNVLRVKRIADYASNN